MVHMSVGETTQTTTVADAIRDLELDDVLGVREEIDICGCVRDPDGNRLELTVSREEALAEIDEWIAAHDDDEYS